MSKAVLVIIYHWVQRETEKVGAKDVEQATRNDEEWIYLVSFVTISIAYSWKRSLTQDSYFFGTYENYGHIISILSTYGTCCSRFYYHFLAISFGSFYTIVVMLSLSTSCDIVIIMTRCIHTGPVWCLHRINSLNGYAFPSEIIYRKIIIVENYN